jgi:hypothetical protein
MRLKSASLRIALLPLPFSFFKETLLKNLLLRAIF